MVSRPVTAGLAMIAGLGACSFDPIELNGLQCPCASGWVCVDDVCLEGRADAGPDLGPLDLGERDAGSPDAGPLDSGPPAEDASVNDLGSDAGPLSVCETTTAFFCDGFEGELVPPWRSSRLTNDATFTTDGMPFVGASSGHATTIAPSSRAHATADLGGRTGVTIHSRAWLYLPSSSPHDVLSFLLIGHDANPSYPLVAVQSSNTGGRVYVGDPFRRLVTGGTSLTIPRDRWVCTTLSVDVGSDSPRVWATIDGTVVADETFAGPVVPTADFGNVGIEFTNAATPNAELFIDEVEFGTEPLPCP